MADLKEFLKKQAEEQREQSVERGEVLRDWLASVNQLITQLWEWLRENDAERILTFDSTSHKIRERRLGEYYVKGLRISLPTGEVRIEPVARYSIGSYAGDPAGSSIRNGRVDMTNGERTYKIYRKSKGGGNGWLIVDDSNYVARDLDRPAFEDAVLSLLQ